MSAPEEVDLTDADVIAAAAELPERQMLTYFLIDIKGLSTRKAALAMGVSQTAVVKNLKRARQNLFWVVFRELPEDVQARLISMAGFR